MFCRNCGNPMNDNQEICLNCGVKKGVGTGFCQNCGKPVTPDQQVCLNCGVKLINVNPNATFNFTDASPALNGQNKTTMAIICFFLGGLGIHNFMMGESKKGVFKIIMSCLCGIGGILALIDFIKILTDKYVVDPTKLV